MKVNKTFSLSPEAIAMVQELAKQTQNKTGSYNQTAEVEMAIREAHARKLEKELTNAS